MKFVVSAVGCMPLLGGASGGTNPWPLLTTLELTPLAGLWPARSRRIVIARSIIDGDGIHHDISYTVEGGVG
jgi:hypothetical protein